ncbi:DciA family protein [Streptomyces sp. NPDC006307]|uniref:DciA family protein n=1 Tax=Streptomyces sp. NPDC006307 TaxID=3156748 RepID=UPI0033A6C13B
MAALALRAARANARFRKSDRRSQLAPPPRRRRNAVPVPLDQVLLDLIAKRWPAASLAAVRALWQDSVHEIAKHVSVMNYDAASGLLSVRADSVAWGTQTQLLAPMLVGRLNETFAAAGVGPVRQLRIAGPRLTPLTVASAETAPLHASRRAAPRLPHAFTHVDTPVADQAVADALSRQAANAVHQAHSWPVCHEAALSPATETSPSEAARQAALRRARATKRDSLQPAAEQ